MISLSNIGAFGYSVVHQLPVTLGPARYVGLDQYDVALESDVQDLRTP